MTREERKVRGFGRLINSFRYAYHGLIYAYKNEQNMMVHCLTTLGVVVLGLFFHISFFEWALCFLLIGLVITLELVNTAIEAVVDLVTQEYHPLARVAKDTASAAVAVMAFFSGVVGFIIFVPKILAFFL